MFRLEIDGEERQVLVDALESMASELRMEISSTDQKDVRDMLKKREQVLRGIRDKLQSAGASADE